MNAWLDASSEFNDEEIKAQHQPWVDQVMEWNEKHPLSYMDAGEVINRSTSSKNCRS
jgi:hypothetical protein